MQRFVRQWELLVPVAFNLSFKRRGISESVRKSAIDADAPSLAKSVGQVSSYQATLWASSVTRKTMIYENNTLFKSTQKTITTTPVMRKRTVRVGINALTIICILGAVGGAFQAVNTEPDHSPETSFYIATENRSGGLVASEYPRTLPTNSTTDPVVVGVRNHLPSDQQYTLEVRVQEMTVASNSTQVARQQTIYSSTVAVSGNDRTLTDIELTAPFDGSDLRVAFLLYQSEPTGEPTVSEAYRSTYFWVNGTTSR